MFDPVAEVTVSIELDTKRTLVFNANTMMAFEKETGKNYLDTVVTLFDALFSPNAQIRLAAKDATPEEKDAIRREASSQIIRTVLQKFSVTDLRALVWAALHEYDEGDNPRWPLRISQVGRLLTPARIPNVMMAYISGQLSNMPTPKTMGESQASPQTPTETRPTSEPNGGITSTVAPAAAFD